MTQISEVKFEKQLLNACWKQKSKVKMKESKLLYQPKWIVIWRPSNFDSQQRYGNKYYFILY